MRLSGLQRRLFGFAILAAMVLSACQGVIVAPAQDSDGSPRQRASIVAAPTATPSPTPEQVEAGDEATPTPTSEPQPTQPEPALNPLTGLPVADPQVLCSPPLLVSISNFPPSARPQAGLSAASHVWETFIGEGMTRFLAVYYGDYQSLLQQLLENRLAQGSEEGFVIGPIRSGRVVFEDIKSLFPRGLLITAGASQEVMQQLSNRSSVYTDNPDDINSAGLDPSELSLGSDCTIGPELYGDLTFTSEPPAGGQPAASARIVYNVFNQIGWEYDSETGAYLRFQDQADGSGELVPALEALSGEQLAFENVLVMWAQHRFVTPSIIEMELVYVRDRYGLLFRDGRVYEVNWSTPGGRLLVHDENGHPIPLKPGATFFEVVSYQSTWDAEQLIVRYHNPPLNP